MNHKQKTIRLALAGNPNCGKSVTFNNLTGLHQHVANYPGKTVEQKKGTASYGGYTFEIVDLPGTYGLTAFSMEEIVARDYIIEEKPDIVVNILDACNFERNLYLTLQLLELEVPVIIVLNMIKLAESRNISIDAHKLSELLHVPVLTTEAKDRTGLDDILRTAIEVQEGRLSAQVGTAYLDVNLEPRLQEITDLLAQQSISPTTYPLRWTAIKLLENDPQITATITDPRIREAAQKAGAALQCAVGEKCQTLIAENRYAFISGLTKKVLRVGKRNRIELTEQLDNILLHRIFGLPIFFFFMWLIFQLTFRLSSYPTDLLGSLLNLLGRSLTTLLPAGLFQSLVVDGILGGLSGVLVFIPQIALLFFGLALLEDSGYMARAAFLMDEAMHRIGLHGKSFIPMLLGFGCNVPAVMATRTLTNRREKILTCLLIPFMSCSARLPVYVLLVSAFFPPHVSGSMLFLLYLIGIASAILLALLLNRYILKDEKTDFILELPPYRLPSLNSLFLFVWHRIRHYLEKAGTIILLAAAAIWFLTSFPAEASARGDITGTYAGMLGRIIEPLISPLGFDWKIGIAIITGFAAKELVIGTLATIYSVGSPGSLDLGAALAADPAFSPLVAFSLMLFVLLYVPCLATIAVIRQELSGKWAIIAASLTTGWAWIVCFAVFQIGRQLGLS